MIDLNILRFNSNSKKDSKKFLPELIISLILFLSGVVQLILKYIYPNIFTFELREIKIACVFFFCVFFIFLLMYFNFLYYGVSIESGSLIIKQLFKKTKKYDINLIKDYKEIPWKYKQYSNWSKFIITITDKNISLTTNNVEEFKNCLDKIVNVN